MCGRYVLTSVPEAVKALFGVADGAGFPPRYNIAPGQPIAIVRLERGRPTFALARWGFVPAWVKDPRTFVPLVNARAESVAVKPAFRNAMRRRRCLVPADGFYEWMHDGKRKRPHFIRPRAGGPIAFAGLWETWCGPNGEEVDTVCIVTTRANRTISALHDRMPAVIAPEAFPLWLDGEGVDAETAAALLAPASEALFEAYEVSGAVNRAADDRPELIAPLAADLVSPAPPAALQRTRPSTEPARTNPAPSAAKKDARQGSLFD